MKKKNLFKNLSYPLENSQKDKTINSLIIGLILVLPVFIQNDIISWIFAVLFFVLYLRIPELANIPLILIFFVSAFFDPSRKETFNVTDNLSMTYEGIINIVFILAFLLLFLSKTTREKFINVYREYKSVKYFFFLVVLLLVEPFLFHANAIMSFKESLKYLGTLLLFVSLITFRKGSSENSFNKLIILVALFLIMYSILLYLGLFGTIESKEYYFTRYVPDALSAVDISVLICMFIPFIFYKTVRSDAYLNKIFYSALLLGLTFSMIIYVVRVSLIALAVAFLFLHLYKKRYGYIILLSCILLAIYMTPQVQKLFEESFSSESGTFADRIRIIWLPAISNLGKYFLFGLGGRSFELFLLNIAGSRLPAHNILLNILLENGIFAVILFLCFNYFLFKEALSSRVNDLALYSLLPMIIFYISSMTSTLQPNLFYKVSFIFYYPIFFVKNENSSSLSIHNK